MNYSEAINQVCAEIKGNRDEALKLVRGGAPDMIEKAKVYALLAVVDALVLTTMEEPRAH